MLGDCCADAPSECFGAENDTLNNLLPVDEDGVIESENIRLHEFPYFVKSVYIESETTPRDVYYYFVQGCPHSAPYEQHCVKHNLYETVAHHTQVCHPNSGLLFYNRFCAACNGYRMEETVSFYYEIEICDSWLALNYAVEDLFEKSTGVDELYHLCRSNYLAYIIPNACIATTERRRQYEPRESMHGNEINLCTSFVNPVITYHLGERMMMKNQFCLPDKSASWHCYDGKVRSHRESVVTSKKTAVLWVNKLGITVVTPPNSSSDETAPNMKCICTYILFCTSLYL